MLNQNPPEPSVFFLFLSRYSNNTQFSVSLTGQTLPAADADAQVTAAISTLVVVETTAQLRIAGAKQISVAY